MDASEKEKWMNDAYLQAEQAKLHNEVPVGAVLVREDKLISLASNQKEKMMDPTAHAEILAIRKGNQKLGSWRLNDCTLFVTLEPCLMCLAVCQQSRIKHVVYGARDHKGGALSLGYEFHLDQRLNHRFEVECYKTNKCSEIIKSFFQEKRG